MKVVINQVNAFVAGLGSGNPAGVVTDADNLNEGQMLKIASRVGFSETAFISKSKFATKKLRFFTPTEEVDLCGHATIASWAFMQKSTGLKAGKYTQETKAGLLNVNIDQEDLVYMEQATPRFYQNINSDQIADCFGINKHDFDSVLTPQIVSTGLKDLFVPIKSEAVLSSMKPNFTVITDLSRELGVIGLHVFCVLEDRDSTVAARNFAPLVGIDEESATGTANGAMLSYLIKNKAIPKKDKYRVEQGRAMDNLSYIYGKIIDDKVWIGGQASLIKQVPIDI